MFDLDPRDFIDSDEGYRDTDWDSSMIDSREPFFAHAVPCECCWEPCDETAPAPWAPELRVGACCQHEPNPAYGEPVRCMEWFRLIRQAVTVGEMMDLSRSHKARCGVCNPQVDQIKEAA